MIIQPKHLPRTLGHLIFSATPEGFAIAVYVKKVLRAFDSRFSNIFMNGADHFQPTNRLFYLHKNTLDMATLAYRCAFLMVLLHDITAIGHCDCLRPLRGESHQ